MIEIVSFFLSTGTGRAILRVLANLLVLICVYFSIMAFTGKLIELEKSDKRKKITKLIAMVTSFIISIPASILLSYVMFYVNNRKMFIAESIVYYMLSAGLYLFLVSDRTKDIIKLLKRKK